MNREFLVVDDEPDICWALEHILASKGWHCQKALTAQAALELMMMKHHHFHLAFLDVNMPDLNGFKLAERLRQIDPFIRLVLISAYFPKDPQAVAQAQDKELFYACIDKPFQHEKNFGVIEGCTQAGDEWCG